MEDNDRHMFLKAFDNFIEEELVWLHNAENFFGWQNESPEVEYVLCPINPEHRMPSASLHTHLISCEKKNSDYPKVTSVEELKIDSSQFVSSLTLVSCDNVEIQTKKNDTFSHKKSDTSQDLAELLQAERDAKRRRAAHRGKRVHSGKKTYNDVLREIIANEMQALNTSKAVNEVLQVDERKREKKNDTVEMTTAYLGVGHPYFRGNPYKRWMTIEDEEKLIIEGEKNRGEETSLSRSYLNKNRKKHETRSNSRYSKNRESDEYKRKNKEKSRHCWNYDSDNDYPHRNLDKSHLRRKSGSYLSSRHEDPEYRRKNSDDGHRKKRDSRLPKTQAKLELFSEGTKLSIPKMDVDSTCLNQDDPNRKRQLDTSPPKYEDDVNQEEADSNKKYNKKAKKKKKHHHKHKSKRSKRSRLLNSSPELHE